MATENKATSTVNPDTSSKTEKDETKIQSGGSGELPTLDDVWSTIRNDPIFPLVYDLVVWRDPLRSGLLFAIGNLFFFLVTFGGYSFISLGAWVFLIVIAGSLINVQFYRIRGLPNPLDDMFKNVEYLVSQDQLQQHVETFFRVFEFVRILLRDILYCQDLTLTLKAVGVAIAVRFVGNIFSDVVLLYLVFVVAFLWPRIYSEKQSQIDGFVKTTRSRVQEKLKPHLEQVKPWVDKILKWKTD